jgi:hypothetical protein
MTVSTDSLSRANASFRRGGVINAGVLSLLVIAFLIFWLTRRFQGFALANLTQRSLSAWIVFLAFLGLFLWMIMQAIRSSRSTISSNGLARGDGVMIRWADVTEAEYGRGWLRLTNHAGRRFTVSLVFASSSHAVMEAVQDHLPSGVRLRVF